MFQRLKIHVRSSTVTVFLKLEWSPVFSFRGSFKPLKDIFW